MKTYRSLILRYITLVLVGMAVTSVVVVGAVVVARYLNSVSKVESEITPKPSVFQATGVTNSIYVDEIVAGINNRRAEHKLQSLVVNTKLKIAAENKARELIDQGYWSETARDGSPPWKFVVAEGYVYKSSGILLAKGYTSADGAVAAWIASTNKQQVFSSRYKDIGVSALDDVSSSNKSKIIVVFLAEPGDADRKYGSTYTQRLVDCIGADGKHLQVRQDVCDAFNKAWGKVNEQSSRQQPIAMHDSAKNNAKGVGAKICLDSAKVESDNCNKSCNDPYNYGKSACNLASEELEWPTDRFSECLDENSIIYQVCLQTCTTQFESKQKSCLEAQKQ